MTNNPLLQKVKTRETTLGLRITSPDMVEVCAFLGFDWFMVDHMFTAIDWSGTKEMIRTGEAAGITPIVRVQANPWLGYDGHLGVEVTRAFGIGAQFVMVSHSCNKEIEQCLSVTGDWHRNAMTVHPFRSRDEWKQKTKDIAESNYVIPHAESVGAFRDIEQTLALPGVKLYFMAMTDASKVLTGSAEPDWYSKDLWKFIENAVKSGEANGVMIGANTSYAYTMAEMRERVKILHGSGVKFIYIQSAPFLFQNAIGEFMSSVKSDLNLG